MIYLYIKKHLNTGVKYFGMTKSRNPFKYSGSGSYWRNHLKIHGKELVETIEVYGFDDQRLCTEFALKFSKDNDIVASNEWANLVYEDGYNGNTGFKHTNQTKSKISKASKSMIRTDEHKRKISESNKNRIHSQQSKDNMSNGRKHIIGSLAPMHGKKHSEESKFKMSRSATGKIVSEETKLKISKGKQGKSTWNKGVPCSKERADKIREFHRIKKLSYSLQIEY